MGHRSWAGERAGAPSSILIPHSPTENLADYPPFLGYSSILNLESRFSASCLAGNIRTLVQFSSLRRSVRRRFKFTTHIITLGLVPKGPQSFPGRCSAITICFLMILCLKHVFVRELNRGFQKIAFEYFSLSSRLLFSYWLTG